MIGFVETGLRLGAATLIGGAIGLNRDLHGKPIGVRTLGLVALGGAAAVMAGVYNAEGAGIADAATRVIQGVASVTSMPSSSFNSRTSAARGSSPASILPPGNSQ